MSFVKSKLKVARDALAKKDYSAASDAASQVLEYEPENYNANVFLALSLLELGQYEKSEQTSLRATTLNADNPLAWQGLIKFYERRKEWEKYADTLHRLVDLYNTLNDAVKCAESWQKLVELRREKGTRLQVVEALSLLLPQSPIHALLSTLPAPNLTETESTTTLTAQIAIYQSLPLIEEIVALVETNEEEMTKKEVEKRRTRLGAAGPEVIRKEVGREIWGTSKLPALYDEILNHPSTPDGLRRLTDAKLLRYKERYLHAIPDTPDFSKEKAKVLQDLDELIKGVVILQIADELAWTIFLESKDCETVAGYDHRTIGQFIHLFPTTPAAIILKGYFAYMNIALPGDGNDEEENEQPREPDEDPFDTILNAHATQPNSVIANRVLAELYVTELHYQNAIKVAEGGIELLNWFEKNTGRKLPRVRLGYKVILATSLVHLFPPKHHPRALRLIEEVLTQSPDNVVCLMGRAYILQASSKWEEAATFFARVEELVPDDLGDGLRAREENAWCHCQLQDFHTGISALENIVDVLKDLKNRGEDTARCLWRLGKSYLTMDDSNPEEAYRFFIAALKANPSYAPAFTSLGVYYAEFASPLDLHRASKCFQKAFELDPREAEAARRLAEGFSEDLEWDLVDVVARRTIEGEGGLNAGLEGSAGASAPLRYLPTNSWAWKAVGVVELHRRNYPPAIQAFQIALRAEPDDALSWVRLGEAYSKAGRHVAAIKALERGLELNPEDWICSYILGDVKHQMGNFTDAISAFESILAGRPTEVGVLVSLGQVYLDQGRAESSQGFQNRAEQSFTTSITVGLRTIQESPGFRGVAWKTVGDAIYALSERPSFTTEDTIREALAGVVRFLPSQSDHLSGLVPPPTLLDEPLTGLKVLEIAVAAYSNRISLDSSETATRSGSAWFDLGVALHSWAVRSPNNSTAPQAQAKIVSCLTQALREDPGNSLYWVGLGDAYFLSNAKNAQHAYIKALEIDSKNASIWTSLGLLYLHHNDLELANQSLYRAQTLDPDYAVAWIGQALVATANGHDNEATAMFEHAVGLTPIVPEGDLEFASRAFHRHRWSRYDAKRSLETLLPAFFALERYAARRPDDATGLHLFALVCESLGHPETAAGLLARTIAILEAAYEVSEDPTVERHFTIANSNLARIRLSLRDFEGAQQSFESALGLLPEGDSDAEGGEETRLLRAQALFGSGLAGFMQGDLEGALGNFEAALESAGEDRGLRGQVTVLLAQTMWAIGTDEFRESSKAQLLECISADPENLTAINTLAGMGVLTDDESLVDAALSEILALPLEQRHELDPGRNVDYLLTQYHLGQNDRKKAVGVAQGALFAEPSRSDARSALAALMLRAEEPDSALALLSGSDGTSIDDLPVSLTLQAVAHSHLGNEHETALRKIQRAVMLAPSNVRSWEALALVRARSHLAG